MKTKGLEEKWVHPRLCPVSETMSDMDIGPAVVLMWNRDLSGRRNPGILKMQRGRGEAAALTAVSGALCILEGFYQLGASITLPFSSIPLQDAGALSALAGLSLLIIAFVYRTSRKTGPYSAHRRSCSRPEISGWEGAFWSEA